MADATNLQQRLQDEIASLAGSITEIVAKFRELNNPLQSSKEKVPIATEQLDKISEQTEAATQQMLDRVESIVQREEEGISGLNEVKAHLTSGSIDDIGPLVDKLVTNSETIRDDAYTIMDALQFQDITAQQMNHAASLLEDIENKLHRITNVLRGQEQDSEPGDEEPDRRDRVFDPHADLFDKKTDQSVIDDLFANKKE